MKYYRTTTEFNCGIDLYSKFMYACVMDRSVGIKECFNVRGNDSDYFLKRVTQYRQDMTLCGECTFRIIAHLNKELAKEKR
jgi:hypothetical protein